MPLDKAIRISKLVAEPCLWANRVLTVTLLISVIVNAVLVWHII